MKKKLFLITAITILLCNNINIYAHENDTLEEVKIIYNTECDILTYAAADDIKSITLAKTGTQIIPEEPYNETLVQNAEVLYRFTFKVTAKKYNGQAVTNMPINYIFYTGPVKGYKFRSIDSSGVGYIDIDVRGAKNFTLYCTLPTSGAVKSNKLSITPAVGAKYENPFYCTGYITVKESEYSGDVGAAAGIKDTTFYTKFLNDVRLNGSGQTLSGQFIHYNSSTGLYSYLAPTTATGTTPTGGRTIAVDPYYIPRAKVNGTWKRATVNISNIGNRVAEDGGGAIKQYRIDVYNGIGKAGMNGWGNANRTVTLININ